MSKNTDNAALEAKKAEELKQRKAESEADQLRLKQEAEEAIQKTKDEVKEAEDAAKELEEKGQKKEAAKAAKKASEVATSAKLAMDALEVVQVVVKKLPNNGRLTLNHLVINVAHTGQLIKVPRCMAVAHPEFLEEAK